MPNNYSIRKLEFDMSGNVRWRSWDSGLTEEQAKRDAQILRSNGNQVGVYMGKERTGL